MEPLANLTKQTILPVGQLSSGVILFIYFFQGSYFSKIILRQHTNRVDKSLGKNLNLKDFDFILV